MQWVHRITRARSTNRVFFILSVQRGLGKLQHVTLNAVVEAQVLVDLCGDKKKGKLRKTGIEGKGERAILVAAAVPVRPSLPVPQ